MDLDTSVKAFAALAHETRLKAFKMLVVAGPEGLTAGTISNQLEMPHNTLSFHLSHLSEAGLIQAQKNGRSMIYSANYTITQALIRYMVENCCAVDFACMHENDKTGCTTIELKEVM
ncbi:MAG: metalloregulator ArsR/SmtB family transcription factor [Alphaproteobacteria bacterium]|nr:metalloregulator ArsR/SmtB family transcription factor [Alphaproteobacteria bacterium]